MGTEHCIPCYRVPTWKISLGLLNKGWTTRNETPKCRFPMSCLHPYQEHPLAIPPSLRQLGPFFLSSSLPSSLDHPLSIPASLPHLLSPSVGPSLFLCPPSPSGCPSANSLPLSCPTDTVLPPLFLPPPVPRSSIQIPEELAVCHYHHVTNLPLNTSCLAEG